MEQRAGYRLPAETVVGRVRLQVSDLERSLRFYRDVLGGQVMMRVVNDVDDQPALRSELKSLFA